MAKVEKNKVLDTILTTPGMNQTVKLSGKLSRRDVLYLSRAIERGLSVTEKEEDVLLNSAGLESIEQLMQFASDVLQKAGLTETNKMLKEL